MSRSLLLAWLLTTLPVVGFLGLVEYGDRQRAVFVREAEGRAEGTIVQLVEKRGKRIQYYPVVVFTARDGRRVEFKSDYPDWFPPTRYKVDQRVSVVYVPEAPSRAEIDQPRLHETSVTPFRTVGGIWIGAMTLVCGGLWLVLGRRAGRRPGPHSGPLGPS